MHGAVTASVPRMSALRESSVWTAISRTLRGWCPRCGEGPLYRSYLKQVDRCGICGEELGEIRADDAPPWLTILIVGHLVVPAAWAVESHVQWPLWVSLTVWLPIAAALALLVLPRAKALFLGVIWVHNGGVPERLNDA